MFASDEQYSSSMYVEQSDSMSYSTTYREDLGFIPTKVRWIPTTHLSTVINEKNTMLVSGQSDSFASVLQIFTYTRGMDGRNGSERKLDVSSRGRSNSPSLESLDTIDSHASIEVDGVVSDMVFADNRLAVVSQTNGAIGLFEVSKELGPFGSRADNMDNMHGMRGRGDKNEIDDSDIGMESNATEWNIVNRGQLNCTNDFSDSPALTSIAIGKIRGMVVAADEDGFVHFASLDGQAHKNGTSAKQLCSGAVYDVIYCDPDQIASVNMKGELQIHDSRASEIASFTSDTDKNVGSLQCLAMDPSKNHRFMAGTESGSICLWDVRGTSYMPVSYDATGDSMKYKDCNKFMAHAQDASVTGVLYGNSGNEEYILSCGNDGVVSKWSLHDNKNNKHWNDVYNNAATGGIGGLDGINALDDMNSKLRMEEVFGPITFQADFSSLSVPSPVSCIDLKQSEKENVLAVCTDKPLLAVVQM